jgi:hypothetical protein
MARTGEGGGGEKMLRGFVEPIAMRARVQLTKSCCCSTHNNLHVMTDSSKEVMSPPGSKVEHTIRRNERF